MGTTLRVAIVAMLVGVGTPPSFAAIDGLDHLACYKVRRDGTPRASYSVDVGGPFFNDNDCVVKTPAKVVCRAVTKTRVEPPPPGAGTEQPARDFFCYRFKCAKTKREVSGKDQFAQDRTVLLGDPQLLCAPSVICPVGMVMCPTVPGVCVYDCEGCGGFLCEATRTCVPSCAECGSGAVGCVSTSTCTADCAACPANPATCTLFQTRCVPDCNSCVGGTCQ